MTIVNQNLLRDAIKELKILRAENARLREALEKIAKELKDPHIPGGCRNCAGTGADFNEVTQSRKIALTALATRTSPEPEETQLRGETLSPIKVVSRKELEKLYPGNSSEADDDEMVWRCFCCMRDGFKSEAALREHQDRQHGQKKE